MVQTLSEALTNGVPQRLLWCCVRLGLPREVRGDARTGPGGTAAESAEGKKVMATKKKAPKASIQPPAEATPERLTSLTNALYKLLNADAATRAWVDAHLNLRDAIRRLPDASRVEKQTLIDDAVRITKKRVAKCLDPAKASELAEQLLMEMRKADKPRKKVR